MTRSVHAPGGAWLRTTSGNHRVREGADVVKRFGAPRAEPVELERVPASCVLLHGAGVMPAWGAAEARVHLPWR